MSKYILTISKDYVSDWTVKEAVRELVQNMLDQEALDLANKGDINIKDGTLFISNKTSELSKSSLVLGCSSKQNDDNSIGKFGEGYKLAMLVLLRNGIDISIHNFHTKEEWKPTIEYIKQYDTDLLVINTSKYIFSNPKDSNLTFQIEGIDDVQSILDEILLDKSKYEKIQLTSKGSILVGDEKGSIFVNGLFVTKVEDFDYSYDIKPKYLKIGRDRNLVSDFDIKTILTSMWKETPDEMQVKTISSGAKDTEFMKYYSSGVKTTVAMTLAEPLRGKVPVVNESDVLEAKRIYGNNVDTIIVTEEIKEITKNIVELPSVIYEVPLGELVKKFHHQHKKQFTKKMKKDWELLEKRINDEK